MVKDVFNVVQIKDITVQTSSAKIAIMVESTTRLQSNVSAKIHFSSTMVIDVLNVSIPNTSTIHKSYVNNVPKIKSIISSSRNVYNVPKTIHTLMAIDVQSAPKILFGMKLAKNAKLAKEGKYLSIMSANAQLEPFGMIVIVSHALCPNTLTKLKNNVSSATIK